MLAMIFNSGCLKNNQTKRKTGLKARSSGRNPTLEGSRGMLTLISFLQFKSKLVQPGYSDKSEQTFVKKQNSKIFSILKKKHTQIHNNEFIFQSLCC